MHDQQYYCRQTRTNDPHVIKHTSNHLEFHAYYELCVNALDIRSPMLLVELFMGERMNPIIYHNEEGGIPLVEAAELVEVEEKTRVIKRILVGLEAEAVRSKEEGDLFDSSV